MKGNGSTGKWEGGEGGGRRERGGEEGGGGRGGGAMRGLPPGLNENSLTSVNFSNGFLVSAAAPPEEVGLALTTPVSSGA